MNPPGWLRLCWRRCAFAGPGAPCQGSMGGDRSFADGTRKARWAGIEASQMGHARLDERGSKVGRWDPQGSMGGDRRLAGGTRKVRWAGIEGWQVGPARFDGRGSKLGRWDPQGSMGGDRRLAGGTRKARWAGIEAWQVGPARFDGRGSKVGRWDPQGSMGGDRRLAGGTRKVRWAGIEGWQVGPARFDGRGSKLGRWVDSRRHMGSTQRALTPRALSASREAGSGYSGSDIGPSAGVESLDEPAPTEAEEYAPTFAGGCLRFGAPISPPDTPISSSSLPSRFADSTA